MAKRKRKAIPEFRSEAEEREFWATHDSADYVDWSQARRARPRPQLRGAGLDDPRARGTLRQGTEGHAPKEAELNFVV